MINKITTPFKWFFKLEAASGLILLISAILALIISNSNLSNLYFETLQKYIFFGFNNFGLKLSVLHWINDVLMAIFFFRHLLLMLRCCFLISKPNTIHLFPRPNIVRDCFQSNISSTARTRTQIILNDP